MKVKYELVDRLEVGHIFEDVQYELLSTEAVRTNGGKRISYKVKCLNCGKEVLKARHALLGQKKNKCQCCKTIKGAYNYGGYKHVSSVYYNRLKERAEVRSLEFLITKEDLWNKYLEQKGKCALTGLDITIHRNYSKYGRMTASVDRIDSSKPYTYDNIQWVHKHINKMKMEFSMDYFIEMCKRVAEWNRVV